MAITAEGNLRCFFNLGLSLGIRSISLIILNKTAQKNSSDCAALHDIRCCFCIMDYRLKLLLKQAKFTVLFQLRTLFRITYDIDKCHSICYNLKMERREYGHRVPKRSAIMCLIEFLVNVIGQGKSDFGYSMVAQFAWLKIKRY